MCRYCRIVAADLLAVLAMDPEQAAAIVGAGAIPLLSALLNLHHSPGVSFPLSWAVHACLSLQWRSTL